MTSEITKLALLGQNIKKFRKLKGLSQNAFGDLLNISREHVAKIETGRRFPSLQLIFKICAVLNIEEDELFKNLNIT